MWQILEKAIGEAAEKFVETRTRSENLAGSAWQAGLYMVTLVDQIERSPKIVENTGRNWKIR